MARTATRREGISYPNVSADDSELLCTGLKCGPSALLFPFECCATMLNPNTTMYVAGVSNIASVATGMQADCCPEIGLGSLLFKTFSYPRLFSQAYYLRYGSTNAV